LWWWDVTHRDLLGCTTDQLKEKKDAEKNEAEKRLVEN